MLRVVLAGGAVEGENTKMVQEHTCQFRLGHLEAMQKGLALFNTGHFWECHEELENHWLADVGDSARNVYWAIIQLAAALYHFQNGNPTGAVDMLKKAMDKLSRCEKEGIETPLLEQGLDWRRLKSLIRAVPLDGGMEELDSLNRFKFPLMSKGEHSR